MPLQMVYGRGGSGKTKFCFQYMTSLLNLQNQVIYIVPEQFSLESEKRIAERFEHIGQVNVMSFERMVYQVFSRFGPLYKEQLNDTGRHMLVQRALITKSDDLIALGAAARRPGFAEEIMKTISEFKRHSVTDDELSKLADGMSDQPLGHKLADLAVIYNAYNEGIGRSCGDDQDSLNILCERIEQFGLFADAYFVIDQFASFTPQQCNVINKLLVHSKGVTVTITADTLDPGEIQGVDVFAVPRRTATRLFQMALDSGVQVLPNKYVGGCIKYEDRPDLAHLESNYFAYPAKKYDKPTENLFLYTAGSIYSEVEAVAQKILYLCREQGNAFGDFTIVTRQIEGYSHLIRHIFRQYGIKFFMGEKKSVLSHRLSAYPISLLDVLIHNRSSESVLRYLKLGYTDLSYEEICFFENYVIASGVKYLKTGQKLFKPLGWQSEDVDRVMELLPQILAPINAFSEKLKGRKTVREISRALYETLTDSGLNHKLQTEIERLSSLDMRTEANETAAVWNIIVNTLDQIVSLLDNEYITFEKYKEILSGGLAAHNLDNIPPEKDQVQIVDLEGYRSDNPKILFVLGTRAGVFPKGHMQEGLLSDTERKTLSDKGVQLAEDTLTRQLSEQLLIYTCITAASEQLHFFYSTADDIGNACSPSPIIARLKALFPNIKQEDNIYIHRHTCPEGEAPTYIKTVAALAARQVPDSREQTIIEWYKRNRPDDYQRGLMALNYTNLPKRLSKDTIDKLYGSKIATSISRLEGYNRCQFANFIQYGLSVYPRKEYRMEHTDVGNLMHGIIEGFSNTVQSSDFGWKSITREDTGALVYKLCEDELRRYLGDDQISTVRFNTLLKKISRIMSVTAWNVVNYYRTSGFEPLAYEQRFGLGGSLPPIELELEGGIIVELQGKIDRVDVCRTEKGDYISIVDYKSSDKDIDYTGIMAGVQVQLPVYIDAMTRAMSQKDGKIYMPAAMLYYKIHAPVTELRRDVSDEEIWDKTVKKLKMKGIIIDDKAVTGGLALMMGSNSAIPAEMVDYLCGFTLKKLRSTMTELLSGNINIRPYWQGEKPVCEYCAYASICQFDPQCKENRYKYVKKIKKDEFFGNGR